MVTNTFVVEALKKTERTNAHYGGVKNDQEYVENRNRRYIFSVSILWELSASDNLSELMNRMHTAPPIS